MCEGPYPYEDGNKNFDLSLPDIYLCLLNEIRQSQFRISISELRAIENPSPDNDLPKRKRTWALRELKAVDGKNESQEFDLEFEKSLGDWYMIMVPIVYLLAKRNLANYLPSRDFQCATRKN